MWPASGFHLPGSSSCWLTATSALLPAPGVWPICLGPLPHQLFMASFSKTHQTIQPHHDCVDSEHDWHPLFYPVALLKEHESIAAFTFTAEFALPVLLLGIFSSSLAFVFFTHSVKSLGIAKANIYTNLIPVFTAIFSILVLRETPLPQQWMGMLLVISGVAMSQKSPLSRASWLQKQKAGKIELVFLGIPYL